MKGVILCGGNGTRLRPLTLTTNKHLIPVFNKQMILYPLQTLLDGGIKDILIVTGGEYMGQFIDLLGSGSKFGCNFTYKVQDEAGGIAQALLLAEDFVDGDFVVILGDNIFEDKLVFDRPKLFVRAVPDAGRFGVLTNGRIVEKPQGVTSGVAVTGCYVYPKWIFDFIKTLKPSARGELEITDVNNHIIDDLMVDVVSGFWSDAGTFESLKNASTFMANK
jgi:glucose-1-phosphate thymidylyltransferase